MSVFSNNWIKTGDRYPKINTDGYSNEVLMWDDHHNYWIGRLTAKDNIYLWQIKIGIDKYELLPEGPYAWHYLPKTGWD